jgi:hypothetical protein
MRRVGGVLRLAAKLHFRTCPAYYLSVFAAPGGVTHGIDWATEDEPPNFQYARQIRVGAGR